MEEFGIYVHIPFCKKKCYYCDFISFDCMENKIDDYINSLIKEINQKDIIEKSDDNVILKNFTGKKVTSIYIGGGTPSFIDSQYILKILDAIKNKYELKENAEITIEVNPGTVTEEKLIDYKNAGINRLSIGLQSADDRILKLIGRIHTYEQFLNTYNLAEKVGFKNINVDLMLAIPTQTEKELVDSVVKVVNLNPNHISLYSLILEENTKLEELVKNKELELIDDDAERKMYWKTKNLLKKNGYNHYEISNFSKKSFESKHNMNCWNQEEYVGYGLAAHSYFSNTRFSNTDDLNEYILNINNDNINEIIEIEEVQDREKKAKEYMMLGFRKIKGISISDFERKFRVHPLFYFRFELEKLEKEGLIEIDLDNILLTEKGLDLANQVFEEFV